MNVFFSVSFQSFDLNLLGPHIVSSSLTHLPSHLRDRRHQESMLRLFSTVAEMMRAGYPEVALEVAPHERWALQESLAALGDELACAGEEGVFPLGLGGVKVGGQGGLAQTMARDATLQEEAALATAMNNHGLWLFKVLYAVRFKIYYTVPYIHRLI